MKRAQSSEPSVFYPDPTLYSPRRISSWPDQSAIPANESLHPYPNPLPDQPPPHLFHLQTDATPWTGVDNVDIPLCLSPTSIPLSVPDALPVEYPPPKDGLAHYQTPPSTRGSSSTRSSTSQTSLESTPATDVTMGLVAGVPQLTLFDAQPLVGSVTVLPQRRYQERQYSGALSRVPTQVIWLGTYGYPVSSVTVVQSRKGQSLSDLPNAKLSAFPAIEVGQKLSWRFLFDGYMVFEHQFNVLDAKKNQPTVERVIFETVKALKYFKKQELRFLYPLERLVILEIELMSRASVQAKIGVLEHLAASRRITP